MGHHAQQRGAADVDQGVEEIAEPGNDKADHQRGEDPREVGAEVKQAAGQTAQPLRGDIGDQRPAESHHPLAKGQTTSPGSPPGRSPASWR